MISVIVATHDLERSLVPTLSALVPGATVGLLGEVVVADAGSKDATAEVGGSRRLPFRCLAQSARRAAEGGGGFDARPWLMFLHAGTVLEPGWVDIVDRFIEKADLIEGSARAAVFRPPGFADLLRPGLGELLAMLRVTLGGGPKPEQGLLIARALYNDLGGHRPRRSPTPRCCAGSAAAASPCCRRGLSPARYDT